MSEACQTIFVGPTHVEKAPVCTGTFQFSPRQGKTKLRLWLCPWYRKRRYLTSKSCQEIHSQLETFDGRGNRTRLILAWQRARDSGIYSLRRVEMSESVGREWIYGFERCQSGVELINHKSRELVGGMQKNV